VSVEEVVLAESKKTLVVDTARAHRSSFIRCTNQLH